MCNVMHIILRTCGPSFVHRFKKWNDFGAKLTIVSKGIVSEWQSGANLQQCTMYSMRDNGVPAVPQAIGVAQLCTILQCSGSTFGNKGFMDCGMNLMEFRFI